MKPHIGGFHIIQGLRHLFRTRLLDGKKLIHGFGDFLANVNIKKSNQNSQYHDYCFRFKTSESLLSTCVFSCLHVGLNRLNPFQRDPFSRNPIDSNRLQPTHPKYIRPPNPGVFALQQTPAIAIPERNPETSVWNKCIGTSWNQLGP